MRKHRTVKKLLNLYLLLNLLQIVISVIWDYIESIIFYHRYISEKFEEFNLFNIILILEAVGRYETYSFIF